MNASFSQDPAVPEEFIELLEALLDGSIDEAGRARFAALLREQPALVEVAREQLVLGRAMTRLDLAEDDGFAELAAAHIARTADESERLFERRLITRISRRQRIVSGFAWAAAVVLVAALAISFASRWRIPQRVAPMAVTDPPAAPVEVAHLMRLAKDDDAAYDWPVEPVKAGQSFVEDHGLLRLEFANGAKVAIEAPARFTVVSDQMVELESGRLNGWCPDTAHGFQVRTGEGLLTDLGTSFGINVTPEHSEFVVLDGRVAVEKGAQKIELSQGQAAESRDKQPLKATAFSPSDFRNTWALTYGILATRGDAESPDPDLLAKLVNLEDDDNLLVIPERRNVPFDRPLKAEVTHPGTMPGEITGAIFTLPPVLGKKLSSVIIRYNPVGVVTEPYFKRFAGSVTFDRPVLAIAGQKAVLEDGDPVFSTARWNNIYRGIELQQNFNPPDSVTLSADRRTVSVVFYTGASTDDIRVILEDN